MNAIILYASAIILKIKPKTIRVILASAIGSIYAIITYVTELPIYTSIISKAVLSIMMVYVGFNPQSIKKLFKQVFIFYLTSFVFEYSWLILSKKSAMIGAWSGRYAII